MSDADEAREATRDLLSLGQTIHIVSATETITGGLLNWLAAQVDGAAATINLSLQSRCERRL
jgi:hypothetical protein